MQKGFKVLLNGSGFVGTSSMYLNNINTVPVVIDCDVCGLCKSQNVVKCKLARWFIETDLDKCYKLTALPNVSKEHFVEYDFGEPRVAVINLTFRDNHNPVQSHVQAGIWFGLAIGQRRARKK